MKTAMYRITAILVVLILGGGVWAFFKMSAPEPPTSFEECASAGNPVQESYPRQCKTRGGETFLEDSVNEAEKLDIIRVSAPRPNQRVESPLVVEGEARGSWFFEGSFVVFLLNREGNVIASATAEAQREGIPEDFVPFRAVLEFRKPSTQVGLLLLQKEESAGLPEDDDELFIPLIFE